MKQPNRRSFLKIAGSSLGIGVLYSAYPAAAPRRRSGRSIFRPWPGQWGKGQPHFRFFNSAMPMWASMGRLIPSGTKAFERAVELINAPCIGVRISSSSPATLTHDTEDRNIHVQRMKQFQEISKRINVPMIQARSGRARCRARQRRVYTAKFFGETLLLLRSPRRALRSARQCLTRQA